MFRTCQQVLAPSLGGGPAGAFLESLAEIAATPQVRRALRNSQTGGFSAGGAARSLDQHGQWTKLVAQLQNAIRAVYADPAERKEAQRRRDDLLDATSIAKGQARAICADLDQLFDEVLADAGSGSPPAG
jgi:predicted aminopeptidase